MLKSTTLCFTGHRPKSLPWGYNEQGLRFFLFKRKLRKAIINAIKDGYDHFISGMALGMDMLSAEIVLELKSKYPNIKLECAIPCTNQSSKWPIESAVRYNKILSQADIVTYVSKTSYYDGCMQKRNKYMLENSSRIIACYNGTAGGTKQTIELANKLNVDTIIIKP